MKSRLPRAACALLLLSAALTTTPAWAGSLPPTCGTVIDFDPVFMGANATCDEAMFMLNVEVTGYSDCINPASNFVIFAEDGTVAGGPKITVFTAPCSSAAGILTSNVAVVPFFSNGVVAFTYEIVGANPALCGATPGVSVVNLPDFAALTMNAAVENLDANFNGADVDLTWNLPASAGDAYQSIAIERSELFGGNPAGAFECIAVIAGSLTTYTDIAPPVSVGGTGYEYRLYGIMNPTASIGAMGAAPLADCTDFMNIFGTADYCGTQASSVTAMPPATATLDIDDLVPANPGQSDVKVPVLLTSAGHGGVTAIGIGVRHDDLVLEYCAAMPGGDLNALLQTPADGFQHSAVDVDGTTVGLIVDGGLGGFTDTVPVGGPFEVIQLCYNVLPGAMPGTITDLVFATGVDALQIPQGPPGATIENEVFAIDGLGFSQSINLGNGLTLLDGSIEIFGNFVRGDVDSDGRITLNDAILVFFVQAPIPCEDAYDVDDNGTVNALMDAMYLLSYIFSAGPNPPEPFDPINPNSMDAADCGPDPTPDALLCDTPTSYCN